MIKFACSKCGKHIRVDDNYAGKRGKCPRCGEAVVVPGQSDAIRFSCEHCGHRIKVPQRYAGRKGKCPKCQEAVVVPGARKEKKKEAVAEPQGPTITCSLCAQTIPVAEGTTDEFVECPGCGSLVFTASGALASGEGEQGADEESDEAARESEGGNRRRLLIIAGAAAVAIVCAIGAVLYLTSSKSEPPRRPEARRPVRQVADTARQPEPESGPTAPAATPVEETPAPAPAIQLRFAPPAGTRRFVQVTTETTLSIQEDTLQQSGTNRETLTLELEAAPPDANGNTPVAVMLAAVQMKMETGGTTRAQYDSTEPPDSTNDYGKMYSPFVSGRCAMVVSAQGRVVNFDMDILYRAVAEVQLAAQGGAIDPRYRSREEYLQALKTQCENVRSLGKQQLCSTLKKLIVALPEQPLREGDAWSGQSSVDIDAPVEMAATYTLTAATDDVCTIKVDSRRSVEQEPIVQTMDKTTVSYMLSGASQATLIVDRATGWLLSKEETTKLSGQVEARTAGRPERDTTDQIALEITTTVTTLE